MTSLITVRVPCPCHYNPILWKGTQSWRTPATLDREKVLSCPRGWIWGHLIGLSHWMLNRLRLTKDIEQTQEAESAGCRWSDFLHFQAPHHTRTVFHFLHKFLFHSKDWVVNKKNILNPLILHFKSVPDRNAGRSPRTFIRLDYECALRIPRVNWLSATWGR